MTFEQILEKVRSKQADTSNVDFLAVQIDLEGQNGGTFYVEIKNGKVSVEPYEYNDRNCRFRISSENFLKLMDGSLDPKLAFMTGRLKIDGDISKALEFGRLIKN